MSTEKLSHAEQNACGWLETIREYVACLQADRERLEELRDARDDFERPCICTAEEHTPDTCNGNCGCSDCFDTWTAEDNRHGWEADNPGEAEELKQLEAAVKIDGEEYDEEGIRERIQESPLSVEVRDDWHTPGAEREAPTEYKILLSTGGPALRIVGELSAHCEPETARLEHQDWGTPWTEYPEARQHEQDILDFVRCFYFGD